MAFFEILYYVLPILFWVFLLVILPLWIWKSMKKKHKDKKNIKLTKKQKIWTFVVFLFIAIFVAGLIGFLFVIGLFIFVMWLDKRKKK